MLLQGVPMAIAFMSLPTGKIYGFRSGSGVNPKDFKPTMSHFYHKPFLGPIGGTGGGPNILNCLINGGRQVLGLKSDLT